MRTLLRFFALLISAGAVLVNVGHASESPTTKTMEGLVIGTIVAEPYNNTLAFMGIPYAAPPKPDNPEKYNGTLTATKFGKICWQRISTIFTTSMMSEDCLTINVFTSTVNASVKLPVMVWIHGGAFVGGGSPEFAPKALARNFDPVNSTVFAAGFLNSGLDPTEIPGNLGLWDQLKALEWVQRNIGNFGGDPTKVTIFGESAGSASVSLLTYSPMASKNTDLFRSAIMQSGTGQDFWSIQDGYTLPTSELIAVKSGCKTAAEWKNWQLSGLADCLRKVPAANLTAWGHSYQYAPVIDGKGGLLPSNMSVLAKQRNPNISVIIGTNNDEGALWIIQPLIHQSFNESSAGYQMFHTTLSGRVNSRYFHEQAIEILKPTLEYIYIRDLKPMDHLKWLHATSKFNTDSLFKSGALREAGLWQSINSSKVFTYSFKYLPTSFPWPGNPPYKGCFHSFDNSFLFPNPTLYLMDMFGPGVSWTFDAMDNQIVNLFGTAWTNFAKSGDPNNPTKLPAVWNGFSTAGNNNQYFAIDNVSRTENYYNQQAGDLWLKFIPALVAQVKPPSPIPTPGPSSNYGVGYFIATWVLLSLLCICIAVELFFIVTRSFRN